MARLKQCSKCGEILPATAEYFHKRAEAPDGLRADCKICRKVQGEAYRRRPKVAKRRQEYDKLYKFERAAKSMNRRAKPVVTSDYLRALLDRQVEEDEPIICPYCKMEVEDKYGLTFDHIIPVSTGGRNVKENLVGVCKYCNRSKADEDFEEWYKARPYCDLDTLDNMKKHLKRNGEVMRESEDVRDKGRKRPPTAIRGNKRQKVQVAR